MLLGIVLCLCGIALSIQNPVVWVPAAGGLALAVVGLFKDG